MASADALPGERHEGHHVDHAEAGVGAGVARRSRSSTAAVATRAGRLLADEREHRSVVVGVGVQVEQVAAGGLGERGAAARASRPSLMLTTHSSTRPSLAPGSPDAAAAGAAGTVDP